MKSTASDRFCWNAGGLAGAAIGLSAWMPAAALASDWPVTGTVAACTFAFLILVSAYALCRFRHKLSAFTGLMLLLAGGFVPTLLFLAMAQVLELSLVWWPDGSSGSPGSFAWVLLLYPALAAPLWWLNHPREQQTRPSGEG